MKEFAKKFYKSNKWKKCRTAYISTRTLIDGGLCEECHEQIGYIVHHKIMLTPDNINNPEVSLNHDNLEYVCHSCHDKFEGHGLNKSKSTILFDEDGQPYPANYPPLQKDY